MESLTDFTDTEQAKYLDIFALEYRVVRHRRFEVWTCLAGLHLSGKLTQQLPEMAQRR